LKKIMLKTMQPFSLGHMRALEVIESPFICLGRLPALSDAIKAALICAQPASGPFAFNGWFTLLKVKIWLRRCRKLDLFTERDRIQAHVLAGLRKIRDEVNPALAAKGVEK
jgi:hypothetical protein